MQDGRTAAQIAECKQYREIVELLCPSGATGLEGGEAKLPKIRLPIQWPSLKRSSKLVCAIIVVNTLINNNIVNKIKYCML